MHVTVRTLVERTTLFTLLANMQDATALGAANTFSTLLNKLDAQMRLSFTYDQGREIDAQLNSSCLRTHLTSRLIGLYTST